MPDEEWEHAMKYRTERVTSSRVVCDSPCLVSDILVSNSSDGASLSKLYDGSSSSADQKMDLDMLASTTFQYWFVPPMHLHRGLYLELHANVTSISVRYRAVKE